MNVVAVKWNEPNKVKVFARRSSRKKPISNFEPLFHHYAASFILLLGHFSTAKQRPPRFT